MLGLARLGVPTSALAQGSKTVTKWNVRYSYVNGTTEVDSHPYDSRDDAVAAAEKFKANHNNPLFFPPEEYVKDYKAFEVKVAITPPRGIPRVREEPSLPMPAKPGVEMPKPAASALAGTVWSGSEDLQGYGKLSFKFNSDKTVTMFDTEGSAHGRWQLVGNQVTLFFYSGNVVYGGTIRGNSMAGKAGNTQTTWNWNLQLQ